MGHSYLGVGVAQLTAARRIFGGTVPLARVVEWLERLVLFYGWSGPLMGQGGTPPLSTARQFCRWRRNPFHPVGSIYP